MTVGEVLSIIEIKDIIPIRSITKCQRFSGDFCMMQMQARL